MAVSTISSRVTSCSNLMDLTSSSLLSMEQQQQQKQQQQQQQQQQFGNGNNNFHHLDHLSITHVVKLIKVHLKIFPKDDPNFDCRNCRNPPQLLVFECKDMAPDILVEQYQYLFQFMTPAHNPNSSTMTNPANQSSSATRTQFLVFCSHLDR